MSFDELVNATIAKMKADIAAGTCVMHLEDGSYIIFGEDGDTKVTATGTEFRSIEEVRKGRGF